MAWEKYAEAARSLGPNPFYAVAAPYLPEPGHVLELGFGVGTGVKWWLDRGWQVTGIDEDPDMVRETLAFVNHNPSCEIIQSPYLAVPWPEGCDVIAAVFSLFFASPKDFPELWNRIHHHVRPNGLFIGQLLGPEDDWAAPHITTHTTGEVDALLKGWEVLHRQEVNRDGKTVFGEPKHWHVHHLILRRAEEVDHSV